MREKLSETKCACGGKIYKLSYELKTCGEFHFDHKRQNQETGLFNFIPMTTEMNLEIPNLKIPNLEIPNLEIPNLKIPNLEIPNLEIPNLEIPMTYARRI